MRRPDPIATLTRIRDACAARRPLAGEDQAWLADVLDQYDGGAKFEHAAGLAPNWWKVRQRRNVHSLINQIAAKIEGSKRGKASEVRALGLRAAARLSDIRAIKTEKVALAEQLVRASGGKILSADRIEQVIEDKEQS
jgi:hypothetical protein